MSTPYTAPVGVGQLCVAHVAPKTRKSWDQHGVRVKAHWLGPAPDHYRCSWVFVFVSTTHHPIHPLFPLRGPLKEVRQITKAGKKEVRQITKAEARQDSKW